MFVENASLDQMSFAINKMLLTGFDEKVFRRIMSIISESDAKQKLSGFRGNQFDQLPPTFILEFHPWFR